LVPTTAPTVGHTSKAIPNATLSPTPKSSIPFDTTATSQITSPLPRTRTAFQSI
jgi:hypothetical protein